MRSKKKYILYCKFNQVLDFMKKENADQEKKRQKELEVKRGSDILLTDVVDSDPKILQFRLKPHNFIFTLSIQL